MHHLHHRSICYGPIPVWLVSVLFIAACGSSRKPPRAPTPTAPAAAGHVVSQINVHVMDTALRPLADATVEILGQFQPAASAISDVNSNATLLGTFAGVVIVRAAKETFVTATYHLCRCPRTLARRQLGPATSNK
jgi:hypothetical protein